MSEKEKILKIVKLVIDETRMPKVSISVSDLWMLVDFAVKHEEITLSRAAELTGVPLTVWRDKYKSELNQEDILIPGE